MEESKPVDVPGAKGEDAQTDSEAAFTPDHTETQSALSGSPPDHDGLHTPTLGPVNSGSPKLSRHGSFSGSSSYQEDWDVFPPLDRISVLDLLDNFALPQQLEKLQKGFSAQTQKVRKSRDAFKNKSQHARERMVDEWRRRVPTADEQLERYRKRMRTSVDKLGKQWNDTRVVTMREKVSFIFGVMNIFVSGLLMGGWPEYFHLWYTVQVLYFMPIRYFTYHRRGYHYFLADLCYFVNLLLVLSIWIFPGSRRLFLATYCLAFGNNAVAIIMWRNSLVFHSFDKVTSLFIHIMPCATLHCIVHLWPADLQASRLPAIWALKHSPAGSSGGYGNIVSMLAWSSVPYAIWQLSYYFFITVRRRDKIAAGRPTSFTWLRKSYSKTWIGKVVLSLPDALQESAFMLIQYSYAVLTMLPCPLWFMSRYASAAFLSIVFTWSVYNGATYYIDVFGTRFQKELEALRAEVKQWQNTPEIGGQSPLMTPNPEGSAPSELHLTNSQDGASGNLNSAYKHENTVMEESIKAGAQSDRIPLLSEELSAQGVASGIDGGARDVAKERKAAGAS
ncbi:F-box protein [Colletotrichum paranaense]|uniref:Glycerophosphocholine acyltransferase 1 n=5 Tax=Colletotrichum acutatum species complex TaxID=2707335 RepID=A0AAJ0E101_9PEZI|nr:F-box protein [Colletotrichum costaricense]XP_060344747.1 F-box protein [Colletotrichum paranaense]XP_060385350.1 F-box protein [Colletotrichum tamarilloi]KAI3543962.1 F-box protein [Colletotrichum filicis]KAK0375913.1 F-box protein [Colletotrichum limetticola]KAK1448019.1 F-box protein [Colletotrichum cuscutae]KAK1717187.1 F-box protein [Colletotrichum lupini]KAK1504592.1 F-box protein [Colletotrichum tamarilloi]